MPLLPGFPGEIDGDAELMRLQLHWELQTISKGE